jgi:hypothetical protein
MLREGNHASLLDTEERRKAASVAAKAQSSNLLRRIHNDVL